MFSFGAIVSRMYYLFGRVEVKRCSRKRLYINALSDCECGVHIAYGQLVKLSSTKRRILQNQPSLETGLHSHELHHPVIRTGGILPIVAKT